MAQERGGLDPTAGGHLLDVARAQAVERGLDRIPVVDVDSHHGDELGGIEPYVAEPWRRQVVQSRGAPMRIMPGTLADPWAGGRLKRQKATRDDPAGLRDLEAAAERLAVDVSVVLPTDMLWLGVSPRQEYEPVLAEAYARWMTERVLPEHPRLRAMLYLPWSDPEACTDLIERFGDARGVVGFLVTSVRYQQIHQNRFMRIFGALQERGLPLAFHPTYSWEETPFEVFDRFLSVYAYGMPLFNAMQLTNLVINGIPERFPRLRYIFLETGLSWLPFVVHRLDNEYLMRTSEAPLLRRPPGEYIRECCYFSTQPLEWMEPAALQTLFSVVDDEHLLFASNYPRPDFDTPMRIWDLPFLSEESRRRILGGNAIRLLGLGPVVPSGASGAARAT